MGWYSISTSWKRTTFLYDMVVIMLNIPPLISFSSEDIQDHFCSGRGKKLNKWTREQENKR